MKSTIKFLAGLAVIVVVMPLWYVLMYQVMKNTPGLPDWTWIAFGAYVPASLFVGIVGRLAGDD